MKKLLALLNAFIINIFLFYFSFHSEFIIKHPLFKRK